MNGSINTVYDLVSLVGGGLISVNALYHVFDSERDSSPQELEFVFSTGFFHVYGARDGASISVSSDPIKESDLDGFGELRKFSISGEDFFSDTIQKTLYSVSIVSSGREGVIVGIFFSFSSMVGFYILNLGDDIYLFRDIPEKISREEGLSIKLIV